MSRFHTIATVTMDTGDDKSPEERTIVGDGSVRLHVSAYREVDGVRHWVSGGVELEVDVDAAGNMMVCTKTEAPNLPEKI